MKHKRLKNVTTYEKKSSRRPIKGRVGKIGTELSGDNTRHGGGAKEEGHGGHIQGRTEGGSGRKAAFIID